MTSYTPEKGRVVVVSSIPRCDFCDKPGPYDFKTKMGPWAHGCVTHWHLHRVSSALATGIAQLWITKDQVKA